jgi:hypothetical protein
METGKKLNEGTNQTPNKEKEEVLERGKIEKVGGPIELEKARSWSDNYIRANRGETISHLFGREVIEKLLKQKGCAGIRIYYGYSDHDRNKRQLILVGADKYGNNQLPGKKPRINAKSENATEDESLLALGENDRDDDYNLYDQSWPCPGTSGCPSNGLSI